MAAGHSDEIVTLKEFIANIISDSEKILRNWGYQGSEFNTL